MRLMTKVAAKKNPGAGALPARVPCGIGRPGNALPWTARLLLAALFLLAGGMKLVVPLEALTLPSHLPGVFMKFGTTELLCALGLILPLLAQIRRSLTPLAATSLVMILIGVLALPVAG
jgi:hypothetical protein